MHQICPLFDGSNKGLELKTTLTMSDIGKASEIEVLEKKLEKYKKVKQGMMQKLLTGKIRLNQDLQD